MAVLASKMKPTAAVLVVLSVLLGATYISLEQGWLQINHPSDERYPIRGIDVSHHQGEIDWKAVRGAGVAFAYLKATEGGDFVDSRFQANWRNAKEAGLAVGAYHFFTLCRDGTTQAQNVLATVPNEPNTLPLAVDLEFGGNCSASPTREAFGKELDVFVKQVEGAYGRAPILYVTQDFFDAYLSGLELPSRVRLWVRDVFSSPRWLSEQRWILWQYACRGRIPGIVGPVDLNVFQGDAQAWERFRTTSL